MQIMTGFFKKKKRFTNYALKNRFSITIKRVHVTCRKGTFESDSAFIYIYDTSLKTRASVCFQK